MQRFTSNPRGDINGYDVSPKRATCAGTIRNVTPQPGKRANSCGNLENRKSARKKVYSAITIH